MKLCISGVEILERGKNTGQQKKIRRMGKRDREKWKSEFNLILEVA